MNETVVASQPAFILQHRPFRETSLILDIFTRDFGIVGIIAKGVRKPKSKTAGVLLPFKALLVSYRGRTELKLLTQVDLLPWTSELRGVALYCGFYINELICRFCHKHDPHPEVFAEYSDCLGQLIGVTGKAATQPISTEPSLSEMSQVPEKSLEMILRVFELNLMQHIGFGIPMHYDALTEVPIKNTAFYLLQPDKGLIEHPQGSISGKILQAINIRQFSDPEALSVLKHIMRTVINFHLQGKPLKSRAILAQIYKQL